MTQKELRPIVIYLDKKEKRERETRTNLANYKIGDSRVIMSEADSETFDNTTTSLPDTGNYSEYLEVKNVCLFYISADSVSVNIDKNITLEYLMFVQKI